MSEPNTRRKREHERHIKHILDTAESMFAERGFFQTTMHQIALKAEFALGTIYSYFGSKKQLYGKVLETKVDELVTFVTKETLDAPSVQSQVEKFVRAKMVFFQKNLSFLRLYLAEVDVPRADVKHVLPEKLREKYDAMLSDLTGVIWQGIEQGLLKQMDAKIATRVLDGLTNALAFSWLGLGEAPRSIDTEINTITELFLYGATRRQESPQDSNDKKEPNNGS